MSFLLIESIFKVKQDSDLPAYYGNNVLQTKCFRSYWAFYLWFLNVKDSLMSESIAGLRLLGVVMRIHVFIYFSCQLFNLSREHSSYIEIYLHISFWSELPFMRNFLAWKRKILYITTISLLNFRECKMGFRCNLPIFKK